MLFHAFHHPVFSPSPYDEEVKKVEMEEERLKKLQDHTSKTVRSVCKDFSMDYSSGASTSTALSSGSCTFSLTEDGAEKSSVCITCVCVFGLTSEEIIKASRQYAQMF
ncbi:hypothetical protein DXT99_15490 [Pontibacter diazotrophicus]|uniref:Uncharacterized protein n=1 Tax=Pontibacter diazotrophicus TaxID=1400979 RepID=A0A3D8LA35_9BACT|nr:hypothetical protein [Pontibacter diazotrophicus]RDV14194.1 hypothetical protein DXT99_15490 [Pontibacter diazotrophicus]